MRNGDCGPGCVGVAGLALHRRPHPPYPASGMDTAHDKMRSLVDPVGDIIRQGILTGIIAYPIRHRQIADKVVRRRMLRPCRDLRRQRTVRDQIAGKGFRREPANGLPLAGRNLAVHVSYEPFEAARTYRHAVRRHIKRDNRIFLKIIGDCHTRRGRILRNRDIGHHRIRIRMRACEHGKESTCQSPHFDTSFQFFSVSTLQNSLNPKCCDVSSSGVTFRMRAALRDQPDP